MLIVKDRRRFSFTALLVFALASGSLALADTDQDGLVSALKAKYPITQTSPDRTQIAQPGIVMQIVKSGITARPWDSLMSFDNLIVDGAVQQRSRWIELTKTTEARLGQGKNVLVLRPGDKVYITRIEPKTEAKDDLLKISILSYDPLPADDGATQKRFAATLCFKMAKDSLLESAPDQVEQLVEAMLAPDPSDARGNNGVVALGGPKKAQLGGQASPTAAASATAGVLPMGAAVRQMAALASTAHLQPQPAAQASQPEPPAQTAPAMSAPTQNISIGQTIQQVVAAMGQPQQIVDLGAKKTYIYPNLKIRFVNGKVSNVE